ncbi:hypothetical protein L596_018564 [Steinernema carpocapsae]|uniref:Uncharacterized protein n=1 Tax=Steinernema carpocapsae TaxID=34508 RepID=A0A4U5N5F0_STECR|nr:hypothetical protein L596_018564 [Steinernema carpocapsae]
MWRDSFLRAEHSKQGLVVGEESEAAAEDHLVKLLDGEGEAQRFLFDLAVVSLGRGEASRGVFHSLGAAIRKLVEEHTADSCRGRICRDDDGKLRVVVRQQEIGQQD